jgi:predicted Zn-dependent protease
MRFRSVVIFAILSTVCGCASSPPAITGKVMPPPPLDPKAQLTLEQIPPPVTLPDPRPATQPDAPVPVEALALYAAARDAMQDNHPLAAVDILRRAIALDPDSYELYRAMGEARLAAANQPNREEIDAFERAAELHPDDLRLQALIGAQSAALGLADKTLLHLRLAVQTTGYQTDDVAAAAVDLLLARILELEGYDRAALDRYQSLMDRLANPTYNLRSDPELGSLADRPQPLMLEVAALYEKQGRWSDALSIEQPLADADPSNFNLQAATVRMLSNLGRADEALSRAADILMRFDGSSDAVQLLRDVCRAQDLDQVAALTRLRAEHPNDSALMLALTEALIDQGRLPEAQALLQTAPVDRPIAEKLFVLYLRRGQTGPAARLLAEYLAAHPDSMADVEPWWSALTDMSRPNSLRLVALQKLDVDPGAAAAKDYLVWRLASTWRRDTVARGALEAAVHSSGPAFAPAFRQLVLEDWSRDDWDSARKLAASEEIARLAERQHDPALAAELRGLAAQKNNQPAQALAFYQRAISLGSTSSALMLTYAAALHDNNRDGEAEQILLQLAQQQPRNDDAWEGLFQFYLAQKEVDPARRVLAQWLAADPASVSARVLEADLTAQDGNLVEAENMLLKLFADHSDNRDVIVLLVNLGRRTGHLDQFIAQLEQLRHREPGNLAVTEWLAEIYSAQGRTPDAAGVLDDARRSAAADPDLLYALAHLYELVDQKQTEEDVLSQVVALDPGNASASNDLGYTWADQGRNLPRAESLIRVAVAQEPDNQSFLDSMGWVLYKQGRYAEAVAYFQQALGPATQPDPVVLDHFGDVLYRMGRTDDATAQWRRSLAGLDQEPADRDDLQALRLSVLKKLSQRKDGKPVSVAPIGDKAN